MHRRADWATCLPGYLGGIRGTLHFSLCATDQVAVRMRGLQTAENRKEENP